MRNKLLIFSFCFLMWILEAAPPPLPSSGVIERQIEKEYEEQPLELDRRVPNIHMDIPEERLQFSQGKKVFICKVQIKGNESISSKELTSFLKQELGYECSIQDIYALCRKIEAYYAKKGYFLARAYPPPQEINNHCLVIEVLEGKLGNVRVVGNKYYSSKFILRHFSKMQHKPLRYDKFLRSLMLLNENSDLYAEAIFEKGKNIGEADAVLQVEDKRPVHLYLNGNDYGRYLTTDIRVGGRLDKGSLFFYGDKFSIAEVVGFPVKALYFTDVIYTVPINTNGSYLEGAYLTSRFHVQELEDLRLKGRSDIATLKFSHKVRRGRFLSCDIFSYFDYKQIRNFSLGRSTSFDKLRVLTVGGIIDHSSLGRGRDYLNLQVAFGLPGFLNGLNKSSEQSSRFGAKGNFIKFNLSYDRLQKLKYDYFLYFHGAGQFSLDKLTIPEQFYLGGIDTVRGYPLAVALGDYGYFGSIEFRLPLFGINKLSPFKKNNKWKDVWQWAVFFDQGGVFYNSGSHRYLSGAGFGAIINGPWSLSLTIDVGFPLIHKKEDSKDKKPFFYFKLTGRPF